MWRKNFLGICVLVLIISSPYSIIGSVRSKDIVSIVAKQSNRVLFSGYAQGSSLLLWGATGYPGAMVGEPEYGTNTSNGMVFISFIGVKGVSLTPSEIWNVSEAWSIEDVWMGSILFVRWSHEGETHVLFARFKVTDETDVQYLQGAMELPNGQSVETQMVIGGVNAEWDVVPENYTKDANMIFQGVYDRQPIRGRGNCLFFYYPDDDTGFVMVNLVIDTLETECVIGWSTAEWTSQIFPMADVLRAWFQIR